MNKITLEGDTPASTVAMMLALARPHFVQRPPANENVPVTVQPEAQAAEQPSTATEQPQPEKVETAAVETTRTSRKPRQSKTKPVFTAKWPDGSEKTFDALSEAIAAMADALDLCDSKEDVEKFLNDNVVLREAATGELADLLIGQANERIAEILSAEAKEGGEDPLPASDQVGAETRKPAEEPDELKLPEFLDRKAAKAAEPVKVPSLDYMRKLLPAYGAKTSMNEVVKLVGEAIHGAGFQMKPGEKPPTLSQIPEDKRAGVVAEIRKKVTVDEVPEE